MNKITSIFFLLFLIGQDPDLVYCQKDTLPVNKKDTLRQGNIKINPVKLAFNEISVAYEHFREPIGINKLTEELTGIDSIKNNRKTERIRSMSYIIGFIYPSDINHLIEYKDQVHYLCIQYFDDEGISPFINWGLSFKLDFRRYRNTFYWGPEFVEKFVFYPKTLVENQKSSVEYPSKRLQSEYADVLGFSYFIGWQKEFKWLVTDLFFGAGIKYRISIRKIWEEQFDQGPTVVYQDPITDNLSRAYPALNIGFRIGFAL